MEKKEITEELLRDLLSQGLSANEIGRQLGYTGTGIRYHMKKYDLISSHKSIQDKKKVPIVDGKKECMKCHTILPIEEFNVKSSGALTSYCKKCNNKDIIYKPGNAYLMRNHTHDLWTLCNFSHMDGEDFVSTGGNTFCFCIPFNTLTQHLLGTPDEY